jgi:hypothetical protein
MSSPAQQMSGITRTDLQRHDLSVPDCPSKPLGCGGSGRFRFGRKAEALGLAQTGG